LLILGLNAFHGDASACIVRDGIVIAAAEEERFRRIKHWAGFPAEAIRYCLNATGTTLKDLDSIAINSDPGANLMRRMKYALLQRPDLNLILDRVRNQVKRVSVGSELEKSFPNDRFQGEVRSVEHHLAHLSSAFLVSPFEEAVTISLVGFGDFSSAAWGTGRGTQIAIDDRVWFPHSLGIFYQALTQFLGFPNSGVEY
jgi:carbamoyltransferase